MKEPKIFSTQNLSEKFHYVYRVTIDEKYYIGKRSGFLNDLHTGAYKTSSKLVQEKLQNGMTFSKIKILQVFSSSKDALEFEKRILTRVNARKNPKFLNQTNGGNGNYILKQHTEKLKKKMSEIKRELYDENTELGIKRRKDVSEKTKAQFDINTEQGRQNRENLSKILREFYKTEQGRKRREKQSQSRRTLFDEKTEEGRKRREEASKKTKAQFDISTKQGRKQREIQSEKGKERFNPDTEEGRRNKEYLSNKRKEKAKEELQKRKNSSILGELMFDEDFLRENFLILDDKNNPRFLWSVYSKLTGYCRSQIVKEKRIGKLSFLYGIKSIKLSEELENTKIQEIKAIVKSRNEKE